MIWKDIKGFPGYQVSSCGKVRSLDRLVVSKNGVKRNVKGRVLVPAIFDSRWPYPQISLGRGNTRRIHVLVAEAFIGEIPDGMYVCHRDGNPANCHVENLYIGTPKQNQHDRATHGTLTNGEIHSMAKLTESDVKQIRELLAEGKLSQKTIGKLYNITQSNVSHIKMNKLWQK